MGKTNMKNGLLEKAILEKITLTDTAKKDIDISTLIKAIDERKYSRYNVKATMRIYKNLVERIRDNEDIQEMLEQGYDINFKNIHTIDEAIRGFFIKIKRGGIDDSDIIKRLNVLGEILQKRELAPVELLDDLIILADLNRVKEECFSSILERMLIKYHDDVEKKLGVELSLDELQVVSFEGRLKGVKNICYDYIKQKGVPPGLKAQYMEIYSKYIIDNYKLNIPTISYAYSYINQDSEKYNEIVQDFRKYLVGMQVEKLIVSEVCNLYKDEVDDMNIVEIEKLLESNGYIKKEMQKGSVSLSTRGICYDIKKVVDYIETDDELKEIKASIDSLLEEGLLEEEDVYLALRECEDEYKVINILEDLLKRDISDSLKKEIAFFAAEKTDGANIIKQLINKGMNVDEVDVYGMTPLMYACKCGNLEMVKVLMESKMCKMDDANGTSCLMYACEGGAMNVVRYLIESGADVNQKNRYQKTALMYAYQKNDLSLIKQLLESGANVTIRNMYGRTIIEDALRDGRTDVIWLILKYVPNVKIQLSELLKGAENPNAMIKVFKTYIDQTEENGKTPLANLCNTGDFKLAKMLLDNGANINKVDERHKTALDNALDKRNSDAILFLVKNGADKQKSAWYACHWDDVPLLKSLVHMGANLNEKYTNGETLLMSACINNINAIMQNRLDEERMEFAWRGKKGEMKEFLLENCMNINQKSDFKINALTYAWLVEDTKTATILIRKGIDINKKDVEGIMKRYGTEDKELVKALIERGVTIKQTIKDKELQAIVNDIKHLKKACNKGKLDKIIGILNHDDNIAYRRIVANNLLGKRMFDILSKKAKRTSLAKNIVIELVKRDKDFLQWVVNAKRKKVLDLLLKERLLNNEYFEKLLILVENSNDKSMKKLIDVATINISKGKERER